VDDYIVAAILLDDVLKESKQKELRDLLLFGSRNHPERLHQVLPYLERKIKERQNWSAEYAFWILRKYSEVYPEKTIHLVDDAAAYLDPEQGYRDPGNATGFLAEIVSAAPEKINEYRQEIKQLQNHPEEYVQQHCSTILGILNDRDYVPAPNPDGSNVDQSIENQIRVDNKKEDLEARSARDRETVEELETLRKEAKEDSVEAVPDEVTTATQTTQEYSRSQKVKQYVKVRADGYCEGCGDPAPFISKTGEPYFHAHHVHELSSGGSDTPDTVIALCPNCHYRVHHGKDGEQYNRRLERILADIEEADEP
jgi:hypothetical protein